MFAIFIIAVVAAAVVVGSSRSRSGSNSSSNSSRFLTLAESELERGGYSRHYERTKPINFEQGTVKTTEST